MARKLVTAEELETHMQNWDDLFMGDLSKLSDALARIYASSAEAAAPDGGLHLSTGHVKVRAHDRERYSLEALGELFEQERRYRKRGKPVSYGWSSRLLAFIFVFE